ncbi:hypothetical protein F0562_018137 [Nyssa sinensis]|uniref:Uncharacterized protein n=1 Tax=Nyssa sinensis TaxID=561372 RepID=A0A5J4ZBK7_9ASTE|nr:hypothetical protein F0562_018137 [Nyssa sinensis]
MRQRQRFGSGSVVEGDEGCGGAGNNGAVMEDWVIDGVGDDGVPGNREMAVAVDGRGRDDGGGMDVESVVRGGYGYAAGVREGTGCGYGGGGAVVMAAMVERWLWVSCVVRW